MNTRNIGDRSAMIADAPSRRTLFGLGLVCFANLLLEVSLTRIFSATMFYHFTFLAIALALFGIGASGVYVYIRSDRFPRERAAEDLSVAARRFAVATILALLYILANPIDLGVGSSKPFVMTAQTIWRLAFLNVFAAAPFFFAGIVVSLAITHFSRHIGRVYFFDLCGAAIGALVAGILLEVFGGPSLVLTLAVLAAVAAVLFQRPTRATWMVIAGAALLLAFNLVHPIVRVHSVKGVKAERTVFEKWNTFSRVTVERLNKGALDIKIDASAATRISASSAISRKAWSAEVSAFAYSLFDGGPDSALIIGPGGGPDVVNALAAGTRRVVGVEINPIIAEDIMRREFASASERLYFDDRVDVVVDEGRSYIRRSDQTFDVIQATLVDTWAATSSGAFALTENTLYTIEAFADYYGHLTDRGVVTMSRWHGGPNPETERLLVLATAGLIEIGVPSDQVTNHIVFAHKQRLGTLLAKRTAFSPAELDRAEEAARAGGFEILVSPRTGGTNRFDQLVRAGPYSALVADQPHDLSPPTDDRPFFFYFVKPSRLWDRVDADKAKLVDPAVWILLAFGACVIVLAALFILLPLLVHKRSVLTATRAGARRKLLSLLYFAMIGLGFIIIEIALMQKLGLFLGHPSYGLLVVLFALLLATALGARLSSWIADHQRSRAALIAAGVVALVSLAYAVALAGPLHAWVGWPLWLRIAFAFMIAALPGVVMGMMLPLGVRLASECDPELVPWGWGVNGATSVIGTVAATIIAIHYGFNSTLLVGAGAYVLAGISATMIGRALDRADASGPVDEVSERDR